MISIIAAAASNGIIGDRGRIPWSIPEDMAYFRRMTMGSAVIMGRLTYESIGRPLPGRLNIVVSRTELFSGDDLITAADLPRALKIAERAGRDAFICGGASLYREGLAFAERILLTELYDEYSGDVSFPAFDHRIFRLVRCEEHPKLRLRFCIYQK